VLKSGKSTTMLLGLLAIRSKDAVFFRNHDAIFGLVCGPPQANFRRGRLGFYGDFQGLRGVLRGVQPGTGASLLFSAEQAFEALKLYVYLVIHYWRIESGSEGFPFRVILLRWGWRSAFQLWEADTKVGANL
jgi:hypothetical protein